MPDGIYGVSIYGEDLYTGGSPSPITEYQRVLASGMYAVDEMHLVSDKLTFEQVDSFFRATTPAERAMNTVFLATFDNTLEAGDYTVDGYPITDWKVYRDGELLTTYLNDPELKTLSHTDYSVLAMQEYEYQISAVTGNGVEGEPAIASVTADYDGWWLVSEDNPSDEYFQFLYNTELGSIHLEEDRTEIRTFAEKAFIRYGQYNAERGMISGLKFSRDDYQKLKELVRNKKPLILKNFRGDYWKVNIYNPQRILNVGGTETLSVDWVEVE